MGSTSHITVSDVIEIIEQQYRQSAENRNDSKRRHCRYCTDAINNGLDCRYLATVINRQAHERD